MAHYASLGVPFIAWLQPTCLLHFGGQCIALGDHRSVKLERFLLGSSGVAALIDRDLSRDSGRHCTAQSTVVEIPQSPRFANPNCPISRG